MSLNYSNLIDLKIIYRMKSLRKLLSIYLEKKQKKRKSNQSSLSDVQQHLEFSISIIHILERKVEELERQNQILHLQTNMRTETSHINKSTVSEDKSTSLHSLNNYDINLRLLF